MITKYIALWTFLLLHVPDCNCAVATDRDAGRVVGRKGHFLDLIRVTGTDGRYNAAIIVPYFY